jgi:hypothetical protein
VFQTDQVVNPDLMRVLHSMGHQAGFVVLTVYGIKWLRRAIWFPWLNANSDRLSSWISTGAALGSALFVAGTFSVVGSWATGWHLGVGIHSVDDIYDGVTRFIVQRGAQEWMWQSVVKKPTPVAFVKPEKMDAAGKPEPEKLIVAS